MAPKVPINRSIVIESNFSVFSGSCDRILAELKANDFSREDIFAVHLALEEAFANSVKHGNKMDPAKKVKIDYSVSLDKIEIFMTDEGKGFDPEVVPDPRTEENLYKTDGRGLLLIRSYMDQVDFCDGGNCLHMVKVRGKSSVSQDST